jgi:glycosyltransferase involved in cell wall biosynthesis
MRILNVNSLIDPVLGGGTAERTLQISKSLAVAGHAVGVLALDIGENDRQPDLPVGVELHSVKCINTRFHVPQVSTAWLRRVVMQYDVIHLMGHWSILNALVARASRLEGVPYVVCPAGALPVFGRSRMLKKLYNILVGRKLVFEASDWIAVTDDERLNFAAYGIEPGKVTVIPNGIDPDEYQGQTDLADAAILGTSGAPYILFMGRLNPIKGPDLLLEAFSLVQPNWPQLHLVFAGPDGGLLKGLRERSAALALEPRVHFVGYLGGRQKLAAYRGALLLVIPSRSEAMSLVVLEAGASGLSVVLTDQCGFSEVQSVGGGLVVSAQAKSIADALRKLLDLDQAGLTRMGRKLQVFVLSRYTWSAVVEQYITLYGRIVKVREPQS